MKKPRTAAASALVPVVLLLGACGAATESPTSDEIAEPVNPPAGDVSDPTANAADPGDDAPAGDDAAADDSEEAQGERDAPLGEIVGQVDVAGTTYDILEVRRCEPLQMEMLDRDLEVQGFGVHGGERVQIDVYVQEVAGQQLDEVSWAGPEGIFGGPEDAAVTFDGSVVRGSATVRDALTQEQTLPVTFELEVPDEIVQCR